MHKYLIDANLPDHFALWDSADYLYVKDIDPMWIDSDIWHYAEMNQLTIVTKDRDFYDRILLKSPPPKVIHIRFGNMRMRDFYQTMHLVWHETCELSETHKLVLVHRDRLEAIE
jgi:predicted nuclease of predicted toxin-antitoxin system